MSTIASNAECETVSKPLELTPLFLASVSILVIAADAFLWNAGPGAGLAVFFLLAGVILILNRPGALSTRKDWIWFGLLFSSVIQTAVGTGAINTLLVLSLLAYGSGHFIHRDLRPFWRRGLEAILRMIQLPFLLLAGNFHLRLRFGEGFGGTIRESLQQSRRLARMILPAVALCIPFLILLLAGNAVMRSGLGEFFEALLISLNRVDSPGPGQFFFWILVGGAAFCFLAKTGIAPNPRELPVSFAPPKDRTLANWQTRICLLAVNVLFFFANSTDLSFLWGNRELPDGVTYSQFVHAGVYSLTASVILAAVTLSLFFFQVKEIRDARFVKFLGLLWIGQNLVLTASVVFRLKLYVDAYQLTVPRVHVVCGLIVVVIGFLLLAFQIHRDKSLEWSVTANALSVFTFLFILQFWNVERTVANWNVNAGLADTSHHKKIDLAYLRAMGPPAWPALERLAKSDHPHAPSAAQKLSRIREKQLLEARDWKSFQLRDYLATKSIGASADYGAK